MAEKQQKTRVKFPIGMKLVIIISILLLLALGTVITLVSIISTQDVQRTAEYNNLTINRRSGSQAEGSFQSIQAAVLLYLRLTDRFTSERDTELEYDFFSYNRSIAAIEIESQTADGAGTILIPNEIFLISNNVSEDTIRIYFNTILSGVGAVPGRTSVYNAGPFFRLSLLSMVFSRTDGVRNETVRILFMPDDLSESFGIGTNTSFIVNSSGDLLLHPDTDLIFGGVNLSSLPIVRTIMQQGESSGMQITFTDDDTGEQFFGAFYPITGTDSTAVTTIPYTVVFEAVESVTRQNIFLTIAVLSLAVVFIWFFSKTISSPVRSLADAAVQIESGDFGIDLKPQHKDEVGLLTESFTKMTSALNIFGRFTNKDLAVRAMRGEIKPGGLPKHATIFFSDIRGFTQKSENFTKAFGDEASNLIVFWLNEYFTSMVDCVEKTGGVVDKFIGDAVMAHWGTAYSAGSPEEDAYNAVKASIMMRNALHELNSRRKKDDPANPEIVIGCGLNTGIVTAGQLGSEQRMEYTVIGDPVNLASRTEALNKPLGTDILIAEDTWALVGNRFITEEMPPVTVKGKEKPIRMFAVVNFADAPGPKTLAEVRKILNITPPDLTKVNTDAEEQKFKIQGN